MTKTVPELLYFDAAGRCFGLRVALFKAFGKDGWDDKRVEYSAWKDLKPTLPLGQLPVLTLPDGKQVTQTDALTRWAGFKAGLYPTDPTEALLCDEVVYLVHDVTTMCPSGKASRRAFITWVSHVLARPCSQHAPSPR